MAGTAARWISGINHLPEFHQRIQRVQIEQQDWKTILRRYDSPETFFYLDPPYLMSTRKAGEYAHELTDANHRELVEAVLNLEGKVLLSGYPSDLYKPLLDAGWSYETIETTCHMVGRVAGSGLKGVGNVKEKQKRTEALWFNYRIPNQIASHPYSDN